MSRRGLSNTNQRLSAACFLKQMVLLVESKLNWNWWFQKRKFALTRRTSSSSSSKHLRKEPPSKAAVPGRRAGCCTVQCQLAVSETTFTGRSDEAPSETAICAALRRRLHCREQCRSASTAKVRHVTLRLSVLCCDVHCPATESSVSASAQLNFSFRVHHFC